METFSTRPERQRPHRAVDWAIFCAGGASLVLAIGLTIAGMMLKA